MSEINNYVTNLREPDFGDTEPQRSTYTQKSPLSAREQDILQRLARGLSNEQIASELCISKRTVRQHIENIMDKLIASNRTQAVVIALKRGWIELSDLNLC